MEKRIVVPTPGALPCSSRGIGVTLMNHFNNKMAMKAHGRFTVDELSLLRFPHLALLFYSSFVSNLNADGQRGDFISIGSPHQVEMTEAMPEFLPYISRRYL
jgi:hypothetical protein